MSSHTDIWITCQSREASTDLANILREWSLSQDHSVQFYSLVPHLEEGEEAGMYVGDDVCAVTGSGNHLDREGMLDVIKEYFGAESAVGWIMYYYKTTVVLFNEYDDYSSTYRLTHEGEWI